MITDVFINLDKNQIAVIKKARFWMIHCVGLNLSELIDITHQFKNIGGFISNNEHPCDFICVFLRFIELSPSIKIIKYFLLNKHNVFIKVLALLYIRLIFTKKNILNFYKPFDNSKQKIMIKLGRNTFLSTTLKNIINILINKKHFYGFRLPPMKLN
mmetsp:Transcript_39435/g.76646  ORF Transcript_39435/g.76646 Transcript_39435/m.76646 type:complete len:157 (+) Transcript_39435:63-533(+)